MATITLYKEKVNGVGGLIDNLIKSSNNLEVQLGTLKNTLQGVDSSTCNLQDTVDSISSSSKSEKSKIEDLKKLNNKLSEFIETASRKDSAAEEEIKKSKEDFYTKYSYLKPECEKSVIEHICDGVQSAAEWCKEHWKLIVTIAIVIVSVAVLLIPGVGPIIAGACWGAILGACIGGVSGGLESVANGGSFLEGFEDGALSGAISGAIGGAAFAGLGQLGAVAGKGIKCMSGFGKFIKGTASVTKVMSTAMGGFDTIALVDKAFGNGDIATLNAKLHESKAYNIFQTGVTATAVFTGGMTTTMKCFVAGTLVLTASGLVAIENIKPGDMVYAADAETLEVSTKQILETYIRETSSLVHLTINGENIISTYDHPYYVKDKGFVSAEALWIGAELIDKNGNVVLVEQLYRENLGDESVKVYNFQVEDYHTYFVSHQKILVHNATYPKTSLDSLKNTENFTERSLEHIFEGEVNSRGKAVGYHYEGIENSAGSIVNGTRTTPSANGIYEGQVSVNGIPKTANGGKSTFFPENMTPQQVVDCINEAYDNKTLVFSAPKSGMNSTYQGTTAGGIDVTMYINDDGKIVSAFPGGN